MSTRVDDRRTAEAWARTEPFGGQVALPTVAREIEARPGVAPGFRRRSQQRATVAVLGVLSLAPAAAFVSMLADPGAGRTGVRIASVVGIAVLLATLAVWLMARRRRAGWMLAVTLLLGVQAAATVVTFDMVLAGRPPGAGAAWILLLASAAALGALVVASVADRGHAAWHARSLVLYRLAQRGLVDEALATRAMDEPVAAWSSLR